MRAKAKLISLWVVGVMVVVAVLTAMELVFSAASRPERVFSASHSYLLPIAAQVNRTLLPDGRVLEVHGDAGMAYLMDGAVRQAVSLPERRRFASVTVMPGGQVLLWGGIDAQGQVFNTGEWFDPASGRFVPTGVLGLPARAGHTLSVLSDGDLLMSGGWNSNGLPATQAVRWRPATRQLTLIRDWPSNSRLAANATLQADGSVQIAGGVDAAGHALSIPWYYDADEPRLIEAKADLSSSDAAMPAITTWPAANSTTAPIRGPLVMRFAVPVNLRQLNQTVTLMGPEGTVAVQVVGVEGGRLAFVQIPHDLYPGSRYTLFIKNLHTAQGAELPYTAVGFTTVSGNANGIVVDSPPGSAAPQAPALPPLYVMAGGGKPTCKGDQLCRPKGFVRDGAFYPGRNNGSDATGAHWRLYGPPQTLPDTHALEAALPKGSTALIGQVRQIDQRPVAGVTVSIGQVKTYTNAQGVFVLPNLSAGRDELLVDGASASTGKKRYGRFLVGVDVKANAISRMPFVMYLPRILARDEITLPTPTTREVVLTHPDIPGLELHIPPGVVFKDRNGNVLKHIALVPTPVDRAPFPLPGNFLTYFMLQPSDAVVQGLTPEAAKGIRVVYPNYGRAKAGAGANFWVYTTEQGWWMYGRGHVSDDSGRLIPDPGVSLTWALGASATMDNNNGPTPQKPNNCSAGQPVDLQTGVLFHQWNDLAIQDVVPLTLTRSYSSADTHSHMFGIGGNSDLGIHLYTASTANGFTAPQLVLPCGEGILFNQVSGGSVTGADPVGVVWQHTATDSVFYGATLQFFISNPGVCSGECWLITRKDGVQYAFGAASPNQLLWMADRYGNKTQLNYNGGLISQVISPSGRTLSFTYDNSNRVGLVTDNTGRTVNYVYDASNGTLSSVIYPDNTSEQYTYDSNKRMLTMRDRRGTVWVSNQYDSSGRIIEQAYADNTAYQFAYTTDSNNQVSATTVTDPSGRQQRITFDSVSHYPALITDGYGSAQAQTTIFARNSGGLLTSQTDALGRTTVLDRDTLGNVTRSTQLSGTANAVTTQMSYTSDYNQLASITDPLGHTSAFNYTKGCLSRITDADGHSTTVQCNSAGQPTAIQDALGNTTALSYRGYDLQSVTDALGRSVRYGVDSLGRPVTVTDPQGNVTLIQYDDNDRVSAVIDPQGQKTSATYDANGNLIRVSLPNGASIQTAYDSRNRPISRTDALGQSEYWSYDGMGRILSHTDRKGQITQYSYDALGRPSAIGYADGSNTQASYDAVGRLSALSDSASGNITWSYDGLDRVTAETSSQGSIGYSYDAAGRRTQMTPASQAAIQYRYDNANNLTGLSQGSETVQMSYDAAGRRATLSLPNGITVHYGYDAAGQLTALQYTQASGATLGDLAYSYNNNGQRIGKSGSFASDTLPQASSATLDLNSRKTSINGQTLSYDANGDLIADTINTYSWNARGQLTQISASGQAKMRYSYDALGRRISKTEQNNTPIQYLYDGANAVQETQGTNVNPILTGLAIDERFARNDVTGRTYFLADALNSTIALTDATGNIVQRYSYDPYGAVTQSDTSTGFTNPYQYTGREADLPWLYYYRARYYSPVLGGFISEDPLGFGGGQSSFYAYAGSNPLNWNDPDGQELIGAVVNGVLGGIINGISFYNSGCSFINGAFSGFVGGFIGGFITGPFIGGAIGSGITEGINEWLYGAKTSENYNSFINIAGAMAFGGFTGKLSNNFGKAAKGALGGGDEGIGKGIENSVVTGTNSWFNMIINVISNPSINDSIDPCQKCNKQLF